MSGGSYSYIYGKEMHELSEYRAEIERMRDRLRELCAPDAAEATERILTVLDEFDPRPDSLCDLWKAVEWYDSGDWTRDQVDKCLARYREDANPVPPAEPHTPCCDKPIRGRPKEAGWPIAWNPYNRVVQCHGCGHIYVPADTNPKKDGYAADPHGVWVRAGGGLPRLHEQDQADEETPDDG